MTMSIAKIEHTATNQIQFVESSATSRTDLTFHPATVLVPSTIADIERIVFFGNAYNDMANFHLITRFVGNPATSMGDAIRALDHMSVHGMGMEADADEAAVIETRDYWNETGSAA